MKTLASFFIFCVLMMGRTVVAQNLVPNPSFEDTVSCPAFPTPNMASCKYCDTYGATADYFNSCANDLPFFGIPLNFAGNQVPYDGNAYAGLITWYIDAGSPIREFIGTELLQPLTVGGSIYDMSLYDSLLYICGLFNDEGGCVENTVAATDGTYWSDLKFSKAGIAYSITSFNEDIIVGTQIAEADSFDNTLNYLAHYIGSIPLGENSIIGEQSKLLYPNPAQNILHLSSSFLQIKIYNTLGVLVLQKEMRGEKEIDVSELPQGMYLLQADEGAAIKFVKE